MTTKYFHLSRGQRYQIQALLQAGHSQKYIAQFIGVHAATISREIRRNSIQCSRPPDRYKADNAQIFASRRAYKPLNHKTKKGSIQRRILWLLRCGWSPEQIAQTCQKRNVEMLCTESIYLFIYQNRFRFGNDLTELLRRRRRKRRKRCLDKQPRVIIKNKNSIHDRPPEVMLRNVFGHFEIDTAKCKNGYLLVLTERKTLFNHIIAMPNKTAQNVQNALADIPFKNLIKTITSDNGTEFANHQQITENQTFDWYFADTYSPQQRGTNENQIGQIRYFLPRNTDLNTIDYQSIKNIQAKLNNRPRKKLNFIAPAKLFFNQ